MIEMFTYKSFSARDEMVTSAVTQIAEAVKTAVAQRGTASLMLSGGSSPRPVYERLSEMDLPWDKVTIGLVDDRWIERGQAGSNETFLDETLLKGKAKSLWVWDWMVTRRLGSQILTASKRASTLRTQTPSSPLTRGGAPLRVIIPTASL